MNKLLLRVLLALVAASCITLATAGGEGTDPIIGTWQLDANASKFVSGPALKSQTRTYTQSGPTISLVMKTVTADGTEGTTKTSYQLDGKDYPVMGTPDYDSLSAKQVNPHTAEFDLKKGGKTVGTSSRTVSADGKTLTSKTKMTAASGEKVADSLVFHKQ